MSDCVCPNAGFCDRHQMQMTEGQVSRCQEGLFVKPRKIGDANPTLLRSPAVAKTCVHLEPRYISNGEAHTLGEQLRNTAAKLNTRCSGCNGRTTLQRCNGGGGVNGLTTLAWCSAKCVDKFQPKEAT